MSLTVGKITRTKTTPSGGSVDLEDVPAGAAVPDLDATLAGITFSSPPTQAECEALRGALLNTNTAFNTLLARLRVTGGNALIAD